MTRATVTVRSAAILAAAAVLSSGWATAAAAAEAGSLATFKVAGSPVPDERLLDGTVEAVNQATVSAQTAGRIAAINVDGNAAVADAFSQLMINGNAGDTVQLADSGWLNTGTFVDSGLTYQVWTDQQQRAQLLIGPNLSVIGGT